MNDAPRHPIWLEAASVLAALVLTAVAMSAAFADLDWMAPALGSAALIIIVGAVFRSVPILRASGTAVIAQCVVGIIAVLVLCAPGTLIAGIIPTGSSFSAVLDSLSNGVSDLYSTTPPAPSTPGFITMLTIAFTLIAILIDGLVCDLRAPKVSGVLLLVLWMIPVFFAPVQVKWWHVTAIILAFLLLMLSPYFPTSRWRGGLMAVVAGGLALAIGIGLPTLLPEVKTLTDRGSGDRGDLTVSNPFLDLRADLSDRSNTELFNYTSTESQPPPIRLTSVDSFDGQNWAPTPFPLDQFAVAEDGLPWPQGLDRAGSDYKDETFAATVKDYDQQYLPTPYAPAQPNGLGRRWIFDEKSLTVVGNGETTAGLSYSMDYLSVQPSVDTMKNATPVGKRDFETELEVPASLPASVSEKAQEVTASAKNQWEAAALLQAYFRSGEFTYSLDAPERASGDAISDFLVDKKGYCVQFASAMTIMARTQGIPARIGVGFSTGTKSKSGDDYTVTMQDSHAWPELYFDGVGWVRFEPTPGGPAGAPPQWTLATGSSDDATSETTESSAPATEEPTTAPAETDGGGGATESEEPTTTAAAEPASGIDGTVVWAGIIALVILALLAIPAIWRVIQRRRRLRSPISAENVWAEIGALATDYGQSLDPSRTLRFDERVLAGAAAGGTTPGGATASGATPGGATASGAAPGGATASGATPGGATASGATPGGTTPGGASSPAMPEGDGIDSSDTALGTLVDALEAERYGSGATELSSAEARAAVDEAKDHLLDTATPSTRITAVIWPASVFHR